MGKTQKATAAERATGASRQHELVNQCRKQAKRDLMSFTAGSSVRYETEGGGAVVELMKLPEADVTLRRCLVNRDGHAEDCVIVSRFAQKGPGTDTSWYRDYDLFKLSDLPNAYVSEADMVRFGIADERRDAADRLEFARSLKEDLLIGGSEQM